MPVRTFTVYQDASPVKKPSTIRPLGRSVSAGSVLTSSSRRSENNYNSKSLPEKENLHPLTGASINGPSSSGKKRKASESGSVLAPKVLGVAPEPCGSAKSKPKRAELKRKASSQTGPGKMKVKKEIAKKGGEDRKALANVGVTSAVGAVGSTPRPVPRPGARSVSTPVLPTIKEEVATAVVEEDRSEPSAESIMQALIDERCYDLTVSPLADVSAAYLQSSEVKEETQVEQSTESLKEEFDIASQLSDYFLFDAPRLDSKPSAGSLPSPPTPLFTKELDIFKIFDFPDTGIDNDAPKSTPVTPKKPRRFGRSRSLPTTPTKESKKSDDETPSFSPILLNTSERKELSATFTFTSPNFTSTEIL